MVSATQLSGYSGFTLCWVIKWILKVPRQASNISISATKCTVCLVVTGSQHGLSAMLMFPIRGCNWFQNMFSGFCSAIVLASCAWLLYLICLPRSAPGPASSTRSDDKLIDSLAPDTSASAKSVSSGINSKSKGETIADATTDTTLRRRAPKWWNSWLILSRVRPPCEGATTHAVSLFTVNEWLQIWNINFDNYVDTVVFIFRVKLISFNFCPNKFTICKLNMLLKPKFHWYRFMNTIIIIIGAIIKSWKLNWRHWIWCPWVGSMFNMHSCTRFKNPVN